MIVKMYRLFLFFILNTVLYSSSLDVSIVSTDQVGNKYKIYDQDVIFVGEPIQIIINSTKKQNLEIYFTENGKRQLLRSITIEDHKSFEYPDKEHYLQVDSPNSIRLEINENGSAVFVFDLTVVDNFNNIPLTKHSMTQNSLPIEHRKYAVSPEIITTIDRGNREKMIYKQLISKTVLVETNSGEIGAGIFIDKDLVLTNWHVVKNSKFLSIAFRNTNNLLTSPEKNTYLTAKILKYDRTKDLALLEILDKQTVREIKPIKLANINNTQIGDDVFTIGHPEGELFTFDTGIISQIRKNYTWKTNEHHQADFVIQVKNSISNGSSGGPLVNENLELVGLNTFSNVHGQNLNFAISVADIKVFLESKKQIFNSNEKSSDNRSKLIILDVKKGFDTKQTPIATYFIDSNKNNIVDLVAIDVGRTGVYNYYLYDTNEDGKFDKRCYDKNGDGIVERCLKQ